MPDQGAIPGVLITDGGADATVPSSLEAGAPIPDAGLFTWRSSMQTRCSPT